MLVNVEKLFSGKTLKQLQDSDFSDINASDRHLYDLGLITEVFDDVHWHDTKELTRQGFEWFYAYTKLQGMKKNHFGAKSAIRMSVNGILSTIFIVFYLLAFKLDMRESGVWWGIFLVTWSAAIISYFYGRNMLRRRLSSPAEFNES